MGQIVDISEVLLELGLSAAATDEERAMASVGIQRAEGAIRRCLCYDPVRRTRTEYYPQQDYSSQARDVVWEAEGGRAILRRLAEAATTELCVQHIPIRSVTELRIDDDGRSGTAVGAFGADTVRTEGVDFWPNYDGNDDDGNPICKDGIIRSQGSWPVEAGNVRIIYIAGYTAEELHGQGVLVDASPIGEAVVDEAVRSVRRAQIWAKRTGIGFVAGPLTSEKLGDYGYTIDASVAAKMFGSDWDLMPETKLKLESFVNWGYAYMG